MLESTRSLYIVVVFVFNFFLCVSNDSLLSLKTHTHTHTHRNKNLLFMFSCKNTTSFKMKNSETHYCMIVNNKNKQNKR